MNFKQYFEMASFTLPHPIKVNGEHIDAIDMQFEIYPPTKNKEGKTMNQGSRFIARLPGKNKYIAYDGKGTSQFINKSDLPEFMMNSYEIIPNNWWYKARMLPVMSKAM